MFLKVDNVLCGCETNVQWETGRPAPQNARLPSYDDADADDDDDDDQHCACD